jgi:hypothetical protein
MEADTGRYSFRCTECRRPVVLVQRPICPRKICAHCTAAPGWFKNETLRRMFDPDMPAPDWLTEKAG